MENCNPSRCTLYPYGFDSHDCAWTGDRFLTNWDHSRSKSEHCWLKQGDRRFKQGICCFSLEDRRFKQGICCFSLEDRRFKQGICCFYLERCRFKQEICCSTQGHSCSKLESRGSKLQ